MSQKGSLTNSSICQEVMTEDESFYVIFSISRGEELTFVSVKIKGDVVESSAIRSSVKDLVIDKLKKNGLKFYECSSMEDFDMKYAMYKLTEDPDSFKETYEET